MNVVQWLVERDCREQARHSPGCCIVAPDVGANLFLDANLLG